MHVRHEENRILGALFYILPVTELRISLTNPTKPVTIRKSFTDHLLDAMLNISDFNAH